MSSPVSADRRERKYPGCCSDVLHLLFSSDPVIVNNMYTGIVRINYSDKREITNRYNVRMFSDHNLLRTLALSRPYVSLEKKNDNFVFKRICNSLCNLRKRKLNQSKKCKNANEKDERAKFYFNHLRITFSISINRQPSE